MESTIVIENLHKRFGSIRAVNELSLAINKGEVFGLLGPNGAGKTTTINIIAGLLRPDSGKIYFNGSESGETFQGVLSRIGLCAQNIIEWELLTCSEQLVFMGRMYGLSKGVARDRTRELLDVFNLTGKKDKLTKTLSGGMQRRLHVAMTFIHDPEIIILDEPEAGLDPQSRLMVREYIRQLAGQKTILYTTHNMDEAERIVDRVAIIDFGKLLVDDTPTNLTKTYGKGDILEISLNRRNLEKGRRLLKTKLNVENTVIENKISIQERNAISLLAKIEELFTQNQIPLQKINIRKNTLEDVFISLTGRSIRS